MGIRPRLYAARVCAGTTREAPPRPLSGLCGKSRPVPVCGSCPGCSGETSPTQQKSHGAFMLHGFDWFGDLFGGDAGGCGQLLLDLPGLERTPAPPTFPGCAGNPSLCAPPAGHAQGAPVKSPPPNKKAMGLLRSMALIGLGIYGVAMRVDAGSSCWTFLGWEEPPLRPPFRAVREIPACVPPADYNPGRSGETSPTQQKSHGAFMLHGFD